MAVPTWWPWQPPAYAVGGKPLKVEPKVFFANERTFLGWLHFGVTLGGLSLGLLNFGDNAGIIAGLIFSTIAVVSLLYSLYMFLHRGTLIRKKEAGPYQDVMGPGVLVATLFMAFLVNFALRLNTWD